MLRLSRRGTGADVHGDLTLACNRRAVVEERGGRAGPVGPGTPRVMSPRAEPPGQRRGHSGNDEDPRGVPAGEWLAPDGSAAGDSLHPLGGRCSLPPLSGVPPSPASGPACALFCSCRRRGASMALHIGTDPRMQSCWVVALELCGAQQGPSCPQQRMPAARPAREETAPQKFGRVARTEAAPSEEDFGVPRDWTRPRNGSKKNRAAAYGPCRRRDKLRGSRT